MGQYSSAKVHRLLKIEKKTEFPKNIDDYEITLDSLPGLEVEIIVKEYKEDDYLMISGIQHFAFCRRQWALIHLEQQWTENYKTMDGNFMHRQAHNGAFHEKRKISSFLVECRFSQ